MLDRDNQGGGGLDQMADATPTPDLELLLADELRLRLGQLPDSIRPIALLKLDGYSNQEIAERQSCSLATIERRLKMIREIWSDSSESTSTRTSQ